MSVDIFVVYYSLPPSLPPSLSSLPPSLPPSLTHQIEDEICEQFKLLLPEHCQSSILPEDQFKLFTLGTYILLLAKCCRGWGTERRTWERPIGSSVHRKGQGSAAHYQVFPDPLQKYKTPGRGRGVSIQPIAVGEGHSPKLRGDRRGMRLDSGSFLVGVEVSLRDCEPDMTEGLFGPLTQGKGEGEGEG